MKFHISKIKLPCVFAPSGGDSAENFCAEFAPECIGKNNLPRYFSTQAEFPSIAFLQKNALACNDKTQHYCSVTAQTKFLTHAFLQEITPARIDKINLPHYFHVCRRIFLHEIAVKN